MPSTCTRSTILDAANAALRTRSPLASAAATLVGLASALLAGCGGDQPAGMTPGAIDAAQGGAATPALEKVRLQLNWVAEPEFGGFYAAQDKALYQQEGLEVELVQGGPGVPAPQLVASGKVEFAIVAGPQILQLRETGGDLVALYAAYQGNPMGVMVHESSPHQSLEELWRSNSTVSIEEGLTDFKWLSKSFPGGTLKVVPYTANLGQFAADATLAQQCFITSEPVTLELQGVKTRVFLIGETGFDPYNQVLVTTRAYYESHKDQCARLVKAVAAGWRAYLDDPKPFNGTMSRLNPGMSLEAMNLAADKQRRIVETDETKRVGLGGMRRERWQLTIEQLAELGAIKSRPEPDSLFVWSIDAGTAR